MENKELKIKKLQGELIRIWGEAQRATSKEALNKLTKEIEEIQAKIEELQR